MVTKDDVITESFRWLRISGLTTDPTPEDKTTAIIRLDAMMAEWESKCIELNYQYPEEFNNSDPADDSGLERWAFSPVSANLSVRLAPNYGLTIHEECKRQAMQGMNIITSKTVKIPTVCNPNRTPIGSGNRFRGEYQVRYYRDKQGAGDRPTCGEDSEIVPEPTPEV